jgi:hypothetical protein
MSHDFSRGFGCAFSAELEGLVSSFYLLTAANCKPFEVYDAA